MKNKLIGYIAKGQSQKAFAAVEKAGGDLSKVRAIYSFWDKYKDNLVKEKKQFDSETYQKYLDESMEADRELINLVNKLF